MSKKLSMKWIKPPPKNLDSAMEVIDFNVIFHAEDDVEVTDEDRKKYGKQYDDFQIRLLKHEDNENYMFLEATF